MASESTNQDAKNTGRGCCKSISRATMICRECFRSDSIQYAVHDLENRKHEGVLVLLGRSLVD